MVLQQCPGPPGYIHETTYVDLAVVPGDKVTCLIQYIGEVAPVAAPGSTLDGYPTEYDSQHHVNYLDADGNVHEFYFDGSRWQHSNVTEQAGLPTSRPRRAARWPVTRLSTARRST